MLPIRSGAVHRVFVVKMTRYRGTGRYTGQRVEWDATLRATFSLEHYLSAAAYVDSVCWIRHPKEQICYYDLLARAGSRCVESSCHKHHTATWVAAVLPLARLTDRTDQA